MQTIEYRHFQDVFLLYRGGMRYHKEVKDGEDKGYDPYDRYRVIPREEIMYQETPKDKTLFGFSMAKGMHLSPWYHTSDYGDGKVRIAKFLGLPDDYKEKEDYRVNFKLNACFTDDGRLVLFKDGCKPVRREKIYKTFTKTVEEWGDGHKQWGVKNPKYNIKYWEFKNDNDYIIVSVDDMVLWHVLPLMYEQQFRKMISNIRTAAYTMSQDEVLALQRAYCDTLWKIEPFSLDEPWDYTDEQKQYIKEFEEEVRQRKLKEMHELEERKALPGFCDDCGCEHAEYIPDPYAYEMWGTVSYCWLCPDCAHERAMDV